MKKWISNSALIMFVVTTIAASHVYAERINPETDFEYLGAFRLPLENSNGTSWAYGGSGMTYYPNGDPDNADQYPGSLYSISHPYQRYVSEFSIPEPMIRADKDYTKLPMAETLQPFYEITGGKQVDHLELTDIQYMPAQGDQTSDKLHWVMYEYYMPNSMKTTFGWCDLDLANNNTQGTWRLEDFPFASTSRYLFDIPLQWADNNTPEKYIAAGRFRTQGGGGFGPALYAYGPWNEGTPPADGAVLDATQLIKYDMENIVDNFGHIDEWSDGAWLDVSGKQAVMLVGFRSLRNYMNGLQYYGAPAHAGQGSKGYHGEPYYKCMMFYDQDDLAAVAQGNKLPHEVQPYAVFNPTKYMYKPGLRAGLGGVGYDRERQMLYILEKSIEEPYSRRPIVHVWHLKNGQGTSDGQAPAPPQQVTASAVNATTVSLSWDASTNTDTLSGYFIYRDFLPIGTSDTNSYVDESAQPNTEYKYTVAPFTVMHKIGAQSLPISIQTPEGEDTRGADYYFYKTVEITPVSAVIVWETDELATSQVEVSVLYGATLGNFGDTTLKRKHRVAIEGLTETTSYQVIIKSSDSNGNTHLTNRLSFKTAFNPSQSNTAPTLDTIGNKSVEKGDKITFKISGSDPDYGSNYYEAVDLPEGAIFNASLGYFEWIPRFDQVGEHAVTFKMTDGTLSDNETVIITVTDDGVVPPTNPADVTGDGVVNIQDAIFCVNAILSNGNADVNQDGKTDIQDVIEIVNVIIGQ